MEKNYGEVTRQLLLEVEKGTEDIKDKNDTSNNTGNKDATPKDIKNGSLKFDFYFKEGSEDGAVYFDVSFKRGRKITRKKDYNMQTASKLLKELNAAGYLLEERECE